ncbi:unnamed protein product [Closterium sp. NIES-54]
MYAVVDSSASNSVYSSVVSLGASLAQVPVASVCTCVDTSPGAAPEDALMSFTLDSGASHCFFRDRTTLTPLPTLVSVALANPTSGPDTARYTTTLPCPTVPSGSLTGFHVPSFSMNLVGVRPLVSQHVGVWIEPSRETAVCVDGDTYAPLATFTAEPGSGLYTLHTGIRQSWTLPESPQQNGVAERRIDLVMEIARTSMTHARAPHFLWPYAVRYAAHQLNLWPRVSRPEVSPTSLWTGSPGDALRFYVWGCLALVRDTSVDKISLRAVSCMFLGLPEDSSDYTFYHPPLHRFFDSCLPVPPAPLFLTSAPPPAPPVQPPPPGPAPSGPGSRGAGVGAEPVTAGDSSLRGAGVSGAVPGVATIGGAPCAGPGDPGTDHVTFGGAGSGGGATGSLESGLGATTAPDTTPPPHPYPTRHQACQLELQRLEEKQQQQHPEQSSRSSSRSSSSSHLLLLSLVFGPSVSPLLLLPPPPSPPVFGPPLTPPDPSPVVFPPPLPPLSPPLSHTWPSRRSPRACPSSPVPFTDLRTALFSLIASLSTPYTDYYRMYRPVLSCVLASLVTEPRASLSSVSALTSSVTEFASTRCLDYATSLVAAPPTSPLTIGGEFALSCDALEDTKFELDFLAAASPHLCAMLFAPEGDPDALDIPTPHTYAEAVSWPWASQWRAAMDSKMASYRSTGTYVDEVPPLGANVVDGMWICRVKRPPRSPPVFKARYVARGFSLVTLSLTGTFPPGTKWRLRRPVYGLRQAPREWYDTLRSTLSYLGFQPSSADPSLFVRRGSTPFFVLVYVDDLVFATADRVALADMKLELQKRHTCIDLDQLRHYLGLQITRDRAARTITLSQSHMVQQVLQRFELQHSTVQRTPLAVDHRLTGPYSDEPFEPSSPYAELFGSLMYLMTCTRPDLTFPLSILARIFVPGRHRPVHWKAAVRVAKYLVTTSGVGLVLGGRRDVVLTGHYDSSYADDAETHMSTQGYCFSLGSGAVSWRSTRSLSVSTSTVEAEIYAGAMAAQELRWLTFLLTDLSERPSSAPTLFNDNNATILLCREPRLESRVKHINVRYFLLRELHRLGQARFDFVESEASIAYIFTKALPPCGH